ncbi:NUDIX hydrolase [Lachnoclostridium sp. An181]|uniref:NUDIX hydrolase n=1 Tax=Lachnoclostridium sp. An181 TaxID=1965575 RepID=UPI000B36FA30|nr:NUDIX hydrolase [Lachnoclostridium sp. An181]OUP51355.1 NUDIX hydrolase [Lachnoclostridium sp. An181]
MGEHVERINRELKYKGKILEIYADTMRNPDGKTTTWDFVHHNGAAAVVPVTEKGTILMVEQYRPALGRYTLEIPAGALDEPDEPGIVCAKRELEEETGFRSEDIEWLITVHTTVAFCDEKIPIFVARNLIPSKQHLDEDEFIDVRECTVEELKQQIFAGKIEDSKTISAILAFDAKYNRA